MHPSTSFTYSDICIWIGELVFICLICESTGGIFSIGTARNEWNAVPKQFGELISFERSVKSVLNSAIV